MLVLIALAVLTLGQLIIGLLLWLEGHRTKRTDQRLFAIVAFLTVFWTLSVGLLTGVDAEGAGSNKSLFVVTNMLTFSLSCAIVLAVYLFSLNYPLKRRIRTWQKIMIGAGTIMTFASALPVVAGRFVIRGEDLTYIYGDLTILVPVYAGVVLFSIFFEEGTILRRSRDEKLRRHTRTLLLGITLTIAHTILFLVVLPAIFGQHPILYAFGYVAPYYLLAFTGYALLRQGLFDIRSIAARSMAYVLSLSVASLLYVFPIVLLSTYLLHADLEAATVVSLVVLTLIVASLFQPLKQYFNKITSKLFYRDYYDPQDVLDELSNLLVGTVNPTVILTKTREILETSVKPSSVRYLLISKVQKTDRESVKLLNELLESGETMLTREGLDDGKHALMKSEFDRHDIVIAVRLRTAHQDLGFLALGPRRSGGPYISDDRRLLSLFADELSIGLQNALRFEEIERFNATLQDRVEEATKKIRRTNERLRVLDQTKDDFISMASHQLRTPLTSVKGYVSMVLDGDAGHITALQRKLLNQSFISSQRMVYLISDLLNVSRLKTGKFIIEAAPTDLSKVIAEEVEQLVETVKGRGLELEYHKPEHFPILMIDETKMRQVIMNFVDNAIYYTPSGGHIDVYLEDKPKTIEFRVVDNGIGVPKHEQHHLFTKFYRAHNAKRARPDGTGLGIFMAKKVVIAQGGAVIFKSQEGKGSTFGFTFPKHGLMPVTDKTDNKDETTDKKSSK
jgi:signal transduction histidine kinase